jgi:hypothetical protein
MNMIIGTAIREHGLPCVMAKPVQTTTRSIKCSHDQNTIEILRV